MFEIALDVAQIVYKVSRKAVTNTTHLCVTLPPFCSQSTLLTSLAMDAFITTFASSTSQETLGQADYEGHCGAGNGYFVIVWCIANIQRIDDSLHPSSLCIQLVVSIAAHVPSHITRIRRQAIHTADLIPTLLNYLFGWVLKLFGFPLDGEQMGPEEQMDKVLLRVATSIVLIRLG